MADLNGTWKYIAGVEGAVIVSIVGWWIKKERPRLDKVFKGQEERYLDLLSKVLKALDRNSDYLRDWYNELHPEKASRTEFDFDASKEEG